MNSRIKSLALILSAALWVPSCGSDPGASDQVVEVATADQSALVVGSAAEARSAVVHLETWGASVAPGSLGTQLFIRQGSGFFVDQSGLLVTSGHVVATSSKINVFLPGEEEPVVGTVRGIAECADLAVVEIGGDGYPSLDWYDDEITRGLEVFVAGYPNGDPGYALSRGEVLGHWGLAPARWAAIESFVQHTAPVGPGASGGPVLSEDGRVVAVAFGHGTGDEPTYFGVASDTAAPMIEALSHGKDVGSIGARTRAWRDEAGQLGGVWVEAVDDGSPASLSGLLPGDLVEELDGRDLRTDRTLGTYCDVIGSHESGEPIAMQVLRSSTGERLRGELHGEPLVVVEEGIVGGTTPVVPVSFLIPDEHYEVSEAAYTIVSDSEDVLRAELPSTWTDVDDDRVFLDDGRLQAVSLVAAPSPLRLWGTWTTPGVHLTAEIEADGEPIEALLDIDSPEIDHIAACEVHSTQPYNDGTYVGFLQTLTNCGDQDGIVLRIAARDPGSTVTITVNAHITGTQDLEAVDRLISTLQIELP